MPSLFDGPKSVLSDITNVMKQSHEKKVSGFVERPSPRVRILLSRWPTTLIA